jgi:hypothetical protein
MMSFFAMPRGVLKKTRGVLKKNSIIFNLDSSDNKKLNENIDNQNGAPYANPKIKEGLAFGTSKFRTLHCLVSGFINC